MSDDKPKETLEQTKARLLADFNERQKARFDGAYDKARGKTDHPPIPSAVDTPDVLRPHKLVRGLNNDPRMADFEKGQLVQMTRLGLKRQKKSAVPKTESTVGKYYGPAKLGRYVYIDWFASEPWDHMHRQVIRIDYIEPLGTPR